MACSKQGLFTKGGAGLGQPQDNFVLELVIVIGGGTVEWEVREWDPHP